MDEDIDIYFADGTPIEEERLRESLENSGLYECEVNNIIQALKDREVYEKAASILQKKYFELYRRYHGTKATQEKREKVLAEIWGE